ncbi:SCO family protein [Pseudothauera rhizosphaerae]|uniref:SCO family protein n=1 Tax=Pseudothauera rhizosphaerae TaxID=2565932 RepID=A0A4S4ALP0_9RHOO|nr:SCO family protein [Pseudothauera rhizosphaerae]THF60469.1 SCO family protein [Pseudothauera rhizosphaerae]
MHEKTIRPALALAVLLAALAVPPQAVAHGGPALPAAAPAIGGHFELTDQNGRTVRDSDLRGKVALVFFGFTHCPDVCPITVANLTQALQLLGDRADQVVPVLITVDPARDTPEVIKAYLSHFDPRIVGLTGSPERIAAVAAAYKAYYSEPPASAHAGHNAHDHGAHGGHEAHAAHGLATDYRVDHSSFVYLLGTDGRYRTHFAFNEAPSAIADAVRPHLPNP